MSKRVLVINTAYIWAERTIRIGVSVIVISAMARYLGPERFGILNYAVAYLALFSSAVTLGTNRTLVRELVTSGDAASALVEIAIRARIAAALVLLALVFCCATWFEADDSLAAVLIMISAMGLLFQAFEPIELWFQARAENKYPALIKTAASLAVSCLKLFLVFVKAPVTWFAWANVFELALAAALMTLLYRQPHVDIDFRRGYLVTTRLLRECWPELIAGIGTAICMRIDQIMLEALAGYETVGVYAAGVRLSDMWYFMLAAIVTSYYPVLIRHRATNAELYARSLQQMFVVLALLALAMICGIWLAADIAIALIYGPGYEGAAQILRIHCLGLIAVAFGLGSGAWIYAEGRAVLSMYRMLVSACVNVAANFLLIPAFGGVGAALAAIISLFTAYYFFDTMPRSMRHLFWYKTHALDPRRLIRTLALLLRDLRKGF